MNNDHSPQDHPDYIFMLGLALLTMIVYGYFLYVDDAFGYAVTAVFFILFAAEQLFRWIDHSNGLCGQYRGTTMQKLLAFAVPSLLMLLPWILTKTLSHDIP